MSSKNFFLPPLPPTNNTNSSSSPHHVTILRRRSTNTHNNIADNEGKDDEERKFIVKIRGNQTKDREHENPTQTNTPDEELNVPLLPLENIIKQQHSSSFSWPEPLNDESAIKTKQIPVTSNEIGIDQMKSQIHETNTISIRIITWNQQAKPIPSPIHDSEIYNQLFLTSSSFLSSSTTEYLYHHLIVIGTQECENSISKSILKPMKEKWERSCIDALGDEYTFLQGHALQASHL